MQSLQALREKRGAKAKEARNLLDPATTSFTPEVMAQVDGIYAEIDLIDNQIKRIEKALILDDGLNASVSEFQAQHGGSSDHAAHQIKAAKKAFARFCAFGPESLTAEERAFMRPASMPGDRRIQNVQETTTSGGVTSASPATGGYLVPTIIMPELQIKLRYFGGMRLVARILATSTGAPMAWATMDDVDGTPPGASSPSGSSYGELVAETQSATTGDLSFGQVTINAWKFSSRIVPISFEILQDSVVDIESVVLDALLMRVARGQNWYFTNGSGNYQPQGVLTGAATGYTMPSGQTPSLATALNYNALINLYHSVDPAYRISESCAFMMNDQTFKAIKQLVDGNGRPLWLPTTGPAFPGDGGFDTLLGKKLVINQDIPSMAANATPIAFGDFSKYMIRDVMDMQMFRFTDSNYIRNGQIGFMGWARADGRFIDASNQSIKTLVNAAT